MGFERIEWLLDILWIFLWMFCKIYICYSLWNHLCPWILIVHRSCVIHSWIFLCSGIQDDFLPFVYWTVCAMLRIFLYRFHIMGITNVMGFTNYIYCIVVNKYNINWYWYCISIQLILFIVYQLYCYLFDRFKSFPV